VADVQVEDGFTRIANVLLEQIVSSKMNGCQYAIVLIVWRYTYGFKRKEHDLSAGFISSATGYNKRQIEREIGALVSRRIIHQRIINGVSRTLAFNKDFETWLTTGKLADGEKADGKSTDGELAGTPPANKPTVTPGELADQERYSFKDNFKEIQEEETAMDAYRFSFKKLMYTGHIQGYVTELMKRGLTDSFIRDVFLEMGSRGIGPNLEYMKKLAEDWISKGILSRQQAHQMRDAEKSREFPQRGFNRGDTRKKPPMPVVDNGPVTPISPEERERMRELARKLRGDEQDTAS
jgi:phage replication O-like protein O